MSWINILGHFNRVICQPPRRATIEMAPQPTRQRPPISMGPAMPPVIEPQGTQVGTTVHA